MGSITWNIKRKKALLKEIQQTFLEIQQAWDQENLSVVKDNYTEKLYQNILQYYKQINKWASEIM